MAEINPKLWDLEFALWLARQHGNTALLIQELPRHVRNPALRALLAGLLDGSQPLPAPGKVGYSALLARYQRECRVVERVEQEMRQEREKELLDRFCAKFGSTPGRVNQWHNEGAPADSSPEAQVGSAVRRHLRRRQRNSARRDQLIEKWAKIEGISDEQVRLAVKRWGSNMRSPEHAVIHRLHATARRQPNAKRAANHPSERGS
jgi:hypothetical protein